MKTSCIDSLQLEYMKRCMQSHYLRYLVTIRTVFHLKNGDTNVLELRSNLNERDDAMMKAQRNTNSEDEDED